MKSANRREKIWRAILCVITCGTSTLISRAHSRCSRTIAILLATLIAVSLLLILPLIPVLTKLSLIFWNTRSDQAVNKASGRPSAHTVTVPENELQSLAGKLPELQRSDKQKIKQIAEQYLGLKSPSLNSHIDSTTNSNIFSFDTAIPKRMQRSIINNTSEPTANPEPAYQYMIEWEDANGNTKYTTVASANPDRELERLMGVLELINENQNLRDIYEIVAPMLLKEGSTSK